MKKSKLLNFFLIVSMLSVWSWPALGLAVEVDWFGTKSKDQIIYLQGYNAAMAKLAAVSALPTKNTNTVTPSKTVPTASTATATSSVYVTNPMTANLDTGNFRIGSYSGLDKTVYFDSNVNLGFNTLYGKNLNFTTMVDNSILLQAIVRSNNSIAGHFGVIGENSFGVNSRAEGEVSRAGYFDAFGTGAVGIIASGHGEGALAAVFSGNVSVDGDVHIGPALPGKLTVLDEIDNGVAFSAGANRANSKAGFFQANGTGSMAVYAIASSSDAFAGFFDGRVVATDGLRTTKICVGNNLEDPGACLQNEGIVSTAANDSIVGNALSNSGTGVLGQGFKGVYGRAVGDNSIGIYGAIATGATNALAARFDGETEIAAGNLSFTNNLNPRIDINTNVAASFGINFVYDSNNPPGGDWGIDDLSNFVFTSEDRLGIGTTNPNKSLHIKTATTNAEIDLQSGNNTHWGIYQDNASGKLNFWHNDNQVTFSDKGISAKAFCLDDYCIDDWADLKAILEENDTVIDRDIQAQP